MNILKKCLWVVALGVFLSAPSYAKPAMPALQKMSVATSDGAVTVALRYSAVVPYRVFSLYGGQSYRLVLDTPTLSIPSGALRAGGVVRAVRAGNFKPYIKRTVWEFGRNYRIVSHGYRDGILYVSLTGGMDTQILESRSWGKYLVQSGENVPVVKAKPATAPKNVQKGTKTKPLNATQPKPATQTHTHAHTPVKKQVAQPTPKKFIPKPKSKNGLKIVVIDAGHGGHDPGAIGVSHAKEKEINLKASYALRDELEKMKGYKVILTRNDDTFLELHDRYKVAEKNNADLFISLHADKLDNPNVRGLSVYSLGYESLAQRKKDLKNDKNLQKKLSIPDDKKSQNPIVQSILVEKLQDGVAHCSMEFAHRVEEYIKKRSPIKTLPTTTRYGGYAVLKSLQVPAVLVEMGFLSNRTDERILTTDKFRRQFAFYMARAIDNYMQNRDKIGCLQ